MCFLEGFLKLELIGKHYRMTLGEIHTTNTLPLYESTLLFWNSDWIIYIIFLHAL